MNTTRTCALLLLLLLLRLSSSIPLITYSTGSSGLIIIILLISFSQLFEEIIWFLNILFSSLILHAYQPLKGVLLRLRLRRATLKLIPYPLNIALIKRGFNILDRSFLPPIVFFFLWRLWSSVAPKILVLLLFQSS